jgi:hypothetical protein
MLMTEGNTTINYLTNKTLNLKGGSWNIPISLNLIRIEEVGIKKGHKYKMQMKTLMLF